MKKILVPSIAIVLVVLTGCRSSISTRSAPTIRVLSYNIHHGEGMDKELDLARLAAVIRSASPDVVSLQEVDNKAGRTQGVDQARELARLTDMHFIFGSSMDFDGGQYGNAVLTTLAVKESKVFPLPGEPRSALCVTLRTPSRESSSDEFLFIATHLDTGEKARFSSVPLIEALLKTDTDSPAILAGDLNAVPGSPTMQAFDKTWRNATHRQELYTYRADNPSRQLDYVLVRPSKRWKVLEAKVLSEAVASDHRPILAVMQLLPKTKKKKGATPNKPDAGDGR